MSRPVYLAAPLFTQAQRRFNIELCVRIETISPVYLPQRDGGLVADLVREGRTLQSAWETVAMRDVEAIRHCDILVAVLDGACVDDGVACELGMAHAMGKRCLGLLTDSRRIEARMTNPIVDSCLSGVSTTVDELLLALG